ncbi:unnamed protein product [Rotaria sp. Silwood2]|nr:unnamed protein product [Rotaria sp. Silwood2]CAF3866730.1 unnamed protein product [Rotaria sp. Silwood2]
MNLILSFIFLAIFLPPISSLFSVERILCNQSSSTSSIDFSITTNQNISLNLCNVTFNLTIHSNEHFFSQNISVDKQITNPINPHFTYVGHIIDNDDYSSVTLIIYPQLQIYLYLNGTYYYYLSLSNNSNITLKFSQQQLLQYYPQLVNDSLWKILQNEEDNYQQNSFILHDLHFIYELLTLRCESDNLKYKTISFCSLALLIDEYLYEKIFYSNIYYIYTFIEHFNFLLRTLTNNEYGGFLLKNLKLINHIEVNSNQSFDLLHKLSNNISLLSKDYCLVHQMLITDNEYDNYVLGYQSSMHTYDIGGICSLPFHISNNNNNHSEEINLNTGLSILNENITKNLSMFFNGLMKTSYLFFRQMGLNLTLCSINATRRGFFQFNTDLSPIVQHCIDLVPITLRPALKRRAHLCFNHINIYNLTNQTIKQDIICKQSIDLHSSVTIDGKNRKSPYIENALNDNRRGEWFEGNIVGMILTFSLIIWIPVSCFVHFCVDEINKKSLIEKQQDMETLPMKSLIIEQVGITKQTQTD